MISESFLHCKGIGPVKLEQLKKSGIKNWNDALSCPSKIPFKAPLATDLIEEIIRSKIAFEQRDIRYLANTFVPQDQWRILDHFFDEASFFDIETSGLSYYDITTLIVCYHKGKLYEYVADENLNEFLNLLEDIKLLVSFNGASFDVPRILDTFHIPELPCAHIDLRWLCYHGKYRGGLKSIADSMGHKRPPGLSEVDGADAISLWNEWKYDQNRESRSLLIRYCQADVILLYLVAVRALSEKGFLLNTDRLNKLWKLIANPNI